MSDVSEAEIDHLPVTESKETLGVWSSPDGNPQEAIARIQKKAQ